MLDRLRRHVPAQAAAGKRHQKSTIARPIRCTSVWIRTGGAYAAGLDLARAGNTAQAQNEIKAALDDLRSAATSCASVPTCDQQRFVAGFDALLRQGIGSRSDQAVEGDTGGETPEATVEAGEASPVVSSVPQIGRTVTLLKGRELSDIIAMNGPVKGGAGGMADAVPAEPDGCVRELRVHALSDVAGIREARACPKRCCSACWRRSPAQGACVSALGRIRPSAVHVCDGSALRAGQRRRLRPALRCETRRARECGVLERAAGDLQQQYRTGDRRLQRRRRRHAARAGKGGAVSFWIRRFTTRFRKRRASTCRWCSRPRGCSCTRSATTSSSRRFQVTPAASR